jgi:hypothetical protein
MLSGLWSLKWVLLCLLLTACKPTPPPPTPPTPTPTPPAPTNPDITVTGKIMLGPVVRGHSLQLVIYDPDMKELYRPKIGLDGGYGFTLKDYEGAVIAQVTSINPQQDCSAGDYIDEATAKPKCLGKNSILSSTVLKLDNTSSDNQAKLHTTSVTTIAALNAGISINEDGTITVDEKLSPEIIDQSNKTIARALGLGDQSVAEYTPKSIITTDQKFQSGDAYSQALAEISGIEAEGKSLNSIVQMISASIGDNGQIAPAVQDMMVKGIQKVFNTAKELGADTSILDQINKRQDTYPDSIVNVDMVNAPEPPVFKNKTKTSNQQPTWEWISGGTGNNRYQYRFGAEVDLQGNRNWKEISSNSFTPSDNLKQGRYVLEIQEGHISDSTKWSIPIQSTIEIVANQKGSVAIQGEAIQGNQIKVDTSAISDPDGLSTRNFLYSWMADNKVIQDETGQTFTPSQDHVGKEISVVVNYTDDTGVKEKIRGVVSKKVKDVNDNPTGKPSVVYSSLQQGETLEANVTDINDADGIDKESYTYQWKANDILILGEKKSTLFLTQDHVDKEISVTVGYQDLAQNKHIIESNKTKAIENINDQPFFVSNNKIDASEGEELRYKIMVSDKDKDSIAIFTLNKRQSDNPVDLTSMRLEANGNLTWLPPKSENSYSVTIAVTVNDQSGKSNATQVQEQEITVLANNEQSTFNSKPITFFMAGADQDYKYDIEVKDSDTNITLKLVSNLKNLDLRKQDGSYVLSGSPTMSDTSPDNKVTIRTHDDQKQEFHIDIFELKDASSTIQICFDGNNEIKVNDKAWVHAKQHIKEVIQNTWSKHAAIKFDGWDRECTDDFASKGHTKIFVERKIYDDWVRTELPAFYDPNQQFIKLYDQKATINDSVYMIDESNLIEHHIVHEFGHLLGFPHEHERLDTYRSGTFSNEYENQSPINCQYITYGKPVEPDNDDEHIYFYDDDTKTIRDNMGLKSISYQDWQKSPYDPFSVMNYCENRFEYIYMRIADSYERKGKTPPEFRSLTWDEKDPLISLSNDDQKRVKRFYGAALEGGERHLLKNGKFFSGLYKNDEDTYDYYENGVKTKINHSSVQFDPVDLANFNENQYFYITFKPQDEFRYKNNDHRRLFKYQKNKRFLEVVSNQIIYCLKDRLEFKNTTAISKTECTVPHESDNSDYNIFYYDGPFDSSKEFGMEFCQKSRSGKTFVLNERTLGFIDTNNCHDFMSQLKSINWSNKPFKILFIEGEAYRGKINGDLWMNVIGGHLISDQNEYVGGIPPRRITSIQRLWGNSKFSELDFYSNSRIKLPLFSGYEDNDINAQYYINGQKTTVINKKSTPYEWVYAKESDIPPEQLTREVIFSMHQDKLYGDSTLFTGEYENIKYIEGVPQSN